MIIMFMVSAAWTFMMAAIQVHADTIANVVMNTTEFDNGEFWLLPSPEFSIVVCSVVLFSLFGIGYAGLAIMMIFFYRAGAPKELTTDLDELATSKLTTLVADTQLPSRSKWNIFHHAIVWARELPNDIRDHYFVSSLLILYSLLIPAT
ncbi:unnamed protein product [Phytophthora lilii]|uniref:Unnamed protein product n=1 Tax=Phytophthora lilii TaxID=2077276 RepID=A0A9W6U590_9STRA|nr:unnamed protein product [Phytophthora lilii]